MRYLIKLLVYSGLLYPYLFKYCHFLCFLTEPKYAHARLFNPLQVSFRARLQKWWCAGEI